MKQFDAINPVHYKHPSGLDTISIGERLAFCPASCFKYITRAGKKPTSPAAEDYEKAAWFARRAAENKLPIVVDDDAEGVADLIIQWISAELDSDKRAAGDLLRHAVLAETTTYRSTVFRLLEEHLMGCARRALEKP